MWREAIPVSRKSTAGIRLDAGAEYLAERSDCRVAQLVRAQRRWDIFGLGAGFHIPTASHRYRLHLSNPPLGLAQPMALLGTPPLRARADVLEFQRCRACIELPPCPRNHAESSAERHIGLRAHGSRSLASNRHSRAHDSRNARARELRADR